MAKMTVPFAGKMARAAGDERAAAQPGPSFRSQPLSAAERTEYGVSGGRKTALSFLMLILLPFFASLPIMLYQRIETGLWFDTGQLAIVGAFFAVLMLLLCIQLMFSLRARLSLGDKAVTFTLPSGRGPTPMLRYVSHDVPYASIKEVELRREVFGGRWAPVLLQGAHLITKDNRDIPLGYVSEANVDPAFPYPVIAQQIAARAGVPLVDEGSIWRTLRKRTKATALGLLPGETYLVPDSELVALNTSHRRMILLLVNGLVALVAVCIALDGAGP